MSSRSALSIDLPYLHRYYVQPPHAVQHLPAVQPQQQDDRVPHGSNSSSSHSKGGGSSSGLPGFKQLDWEARKKTTRGHPYRPSSVVRASSWWVRAEEGIVQVDIRAGVWLAKPKHTAGVVGGARDERGTSTGLWGGLTPQQHQQLAARMIPSSTGLGGVFPAHPATPIISHKPVIARPYRNSDIRAFNLPLGRPGPGHCGYIGKGFLGEQGSPDAPPYERTMLRSLSWLDEEQGLLAQANVTDRNRMGKHVLHGYLPREGEPAHYQKLFTWPWIDISPSR
ncbi:hypothetical protein TSOC_002557 [Tetrabaena socialis]|uniref:Uncharacterized protein n=1 Tax=Tetrabaena socialis TaxID=47790 RepID=A0A2J8ADV9_9CHLO|nr:hypothetical protein TSOC_002557 [Tetrabaena socialis]|eukprot:PNH10699.1 hypothetical protein TSOC_002557 [Tetrabaena socialis]